MINYIEIDGRKSGEYGLFFKRLPVWPAAVEGADTYTVPGRAENLTRKNGKYNDIKITLEAVAIGLYTDDAKAWLTNGKKLILSTMPDRYGNIKSVAEYSETRLGSGALEIKITYTCSPFKYSTAETIADLIIIDKSPYSLQVGGNIYAEPEIYLSEIKAGGTISINGVAVTFTEAQEDAVINVGARAIYREIGSDIKTVIQEATTGNFWDMVLIPSDTDYNLIEFSKLDGAAIMKKERWR